MIWLYPKPNSNAWVVRVQFYEVLAPWADDERTFDCIENATRYIRDVGNKYKWWKRFHKVSKFLDRIDGGR